MKKMKNNYLRLFFAIELPADIKDKLAAVLKKMPLPERVNLTPKENLHLTLLFLGSVSLDQLPQIIEIAENVFARYSIFDLYFHNITGAPNENYCRMIWLNGEDSPLLERIKNDLESELEKNGINFEKENRSLKIHITLARFNPIRCSFKPIKFPERLRVKELVLMESQLQKPHAVYIPLKKFPLHP